MPLEVIEVIEQGPQGPQGVAGDQGVQGSGTDDRLIILSSSATFTLQEHDSTSDTETAIVFDVISDGYISTTVGGSMLLLQDLSNLTAMVQFHTDFTGGNSGRTDISLWVESSLDGITFTASPLSLRSYSVNRDNKSTNTFAFAFASGLLAGVYMRLVATESGSGTGIVQITPQEIVTTSTGAISGNAVTATLSYQP